MTDDCVALRSVTYAHPGDLEGFFFDVAFETGKITAVMGASGGGKSTLLNLLAGFLRPDGGEIFVDGENVTAAHPMHRPMSMIFQDHNLFAHLTVAQNVGLGIDPNLKLDSAARQMVTSALHSVGLDGFAERQPPTLSGGEKQRVALARMLVRDRPILLMDEALASLGPGLRKSILQLVRQLQQVKKLTVIMVTHNPEDARLVGDNAVFLADRRVVFHGPAREILSAPTDPRISAYLGY